jgi:integrase/recombinase XerD
MAHVVLRKPACHSAARSNRPSTRITGEKWRTDSQANKPPLPSVPASASPFRLVDDGDQEVTWANAFLDAQRIRQLSLRSLRAYGYDLLHFARWWLQAPLRPLSELTESTLLDYVRDQLDREPKPTSQTVNHRLDVLRSLYRFHHGCAIPAGQSHFQRSHTKRSALGYGRIRRAVAAGLKLRQPRRVIVPLSAEQVAQFWQSFGTFRDLALVALMLLDGLRSHEVLALQLEDLQLAEAKLCVLGKGNKKRVLPLPVETIGVLQHYLRLERPATNSSALFVSLKGRRRGQPMTPAGLRSLFRHHRLRSQVPEANPHRFRHTFGADMVPAGISLPALMHLMGHSQIHTTMLYVQLAPQDVWREYARAVQNRSRLSAPQIP